uniref:ARAD1D30162p n=1 Tax=Blastobotrys adeninivorans TaxID=409370 RepID=A0A060TAY6_BLAAD
MSANKQSAQASQGPQGPQGPQGGQPPQGSSQSVQAGTSPTTPSGQGSQGSPSETARRARQPKPSGLRVPSYSGPGSNASSTVSTPAIPTRPSLRWRPSGSMQRRFPYSTDDDEDEIEADLEREYFEGYSDGLKERRRRSTARKAKGTDKRSNAISTGVAGSAVAGSESQSPSTSEAPGVHLHHYHHKIRNESIRNLERAAAEREGDILEEDAAPPEDVTAYTSGQSRGAYDTADNDGLQEDMGHEEGTDSEEDVDNEDAQSTSSVETFTLRERQDAINETHPFGIRIWKPAVYKKFRSVQKIAEGDIHSTPGRAITWQVQLGNILWTIVFGTLLMMVCTIASATCMLCYWSPSAREYGSRLFSLGTYLWFPFGKFVELAQDENYIHEDIGEGRTLDEYERWQAGDVEVGRLFFGPPQRSATAATGDSASRRCSSDLINSDPEAGEDDLLIGNGNRKRRLFGRGKWNLGRVLFFAWYYAVLAPLLYIISSICFFGVFSIPMGKVTSILADQIRRHPLALEFKPASSYAVRSSSSIILCTYRAVGWNYYKYTVDGTNIFFINLMVPVLFVIFDYYFLHEKLHLEFFFTSSAFIFILSLLSVIPLAYFIGQAVASISAQSSMGMGAAINAFFSTIVEVFLYSVALSEGKGNLVEGSIIGSILAGVLLLPGLSMCAGAIRRKTQRYNPRSAGVSSTMLMFAVIAAFAPTIFYQIYGSYELKCSPCRDVKGEASECARCLLIQVPLERDTLYTAMIQPFSYICAVLLFVSYVIGLWFTLRTHASIIWSTPTASELGHGTSLQPLTTQPVHHQRSQVNLHQHAQATSENAVPDPQLLSQPAPADQGLDKTPTKQKHVVIQGPTKEHEQEAEAGGHDAPNWGRTKSSVILLGATVLYAIIAEILVGTVDVVLQNFNISEKLLGLTIFALVPNTTEFLNAISFAMHGNVALSMEIGSAYALQVCLLQVPALVLYSIWSSPNVAGAIHDYMFTLVFPRWDLCMSIFCVFLFSYLYAEGKSNYFKGCILNLAYLVAMIGFYFADQSDILEGSTLFVPQFNHQTPPYH